MNKPSDFKDSKIQVLLRADPTFIKKDCIVGFP